MRCVAKSPARDSVQGIRNETHRAQGLKYLLQTSTGATWHWCRINMDLQGPQLPALTLGIAHGSAMSPDIVKHH